MQKTIWGLSVAALALMPLTAHAGVVMNGIAGAVSSAPILIETSGKNPVDANVEQNTQGAKHFIDSMGKRATGFLGSDTMLHAQKEAEFRKLLRDSFDMKTIGRFALGNYWKVASDSQQGEYLKLFEEMVVDVYAARFSEYNGQELDVRSAKPKGKRDTLVNSYIVDKNGKEFSVDWLVRYKNGAYKIVDVIIEGVSMSITQRSDFSSVIQRGGGNVDVLIDHLRK